MNASQLKSLIKSRIAANLMRPLLVESSPGLGKTEISAQVATECSIAFHAIHAPLLAPEDYSYPLPNKDRTGIDFLVSLSKFPFVGSAFPERGLLLIDEISQCAPEQQKILATLIHDRRIHNFTLLPGWHIILTGNRRTDRAGSNTLLTHFADRCTIVTLDADLPAWRAWALQNAIRPEVIAFSQFRPESFAKFDPLAPKSATLRGWSQGVSPSLGTIPPECELESFSGDIGEGMATEFIAFLRVFRALPSLDDIKSGKPVAVPTDPATVYALIGALVHATNPQNFSNIFKYIQRMPAEFHVLYIRDIRAKDAKLTANPDYVAWATTTGKSILF